MIYHVAAVARNRVIGKANRLPWHFSEDLKFFKTLTLGSTVLMGRNTFDSIGKPLPGRENFVITSHPGPDQAHLRFFSSIPDALDSAATEKVFVIGGGSIYRATLNRIDGAYLTEIDADYEGDTYYPELGEEFVRESGEVLREHPRLQVVFYRRKKGGPLFL